MYAFIFMSTFYIFSDYWDVYQKSFFQMIEFLLFTPLIFNIFGVENKKNEEKLKINSKLRLWEVLVSNMKNFSINFTLFFKFYFSNFFLQIFRWNFYYICHLVNIWLPKVIATTLKSSLDVLRVLRTPQSNPITFATSRIKVIDPNWPYIDTVGS